MDNLIHTPDSNFELRTPFDLEELVATDQHLCKGGTLQIFGDWFGEPYENYHLITNIEFDTNLSVMTIHFEEGETLKIWNPAHIRETSSYLKIISADKTRLEWRRNEGKENTYFQEYNKTEKNVEVTTNFYQRKRKIDASLKHNALIIYGKIE